MVSAVPQITAKRRTRRSKRLGLSVAVLVHGKDISGQPFRELARTVSLNANGALIALSASVQEDQTILIENKNTRQEEECRVVYVGPLQDGKWSVGVAFVRPAPSFWEIYFPPGMSR